MTAANWRSELRQRLKTLDWQSAQADVRPFLERARDIALVTPETLGSLLSASDQPQGGKQESPSSGLTPASS